MKRYAWAWLCAWMIWVGWGGTAAAQGPAVAPSGANVGSGSIAQNARIGLGYDIDLNGFTLRFGSIQSVRFDVSLGLGLEINTGNKTSTTFDFTPGFRVFFPIKIYKMLVIQALAGIYMMIQPTDQQFRMNISLFGGLAPEIFLLPNLSIEIMIGLAFTLNDLTNNLQMTIGTVGKGISIVSGAAFHWYF